MIIAVPFPKPGSVSKKYSAAIIGFDTGNDSTTLKLRFWYKLHILFIFFILIANRCVPILKLPGIGTFKLLTPSCVRIMGVPLPKPGSVSIKYSAAITWFDTGKDSITLKFRC